MCREQRRRQAHWDVEAVGGGAASVRRAKGMSSISIATQASAEDGFTPTSRASLLALAPQGTLLPYSPTITSTSAAHGSLARSRSVP